MGVTVGFRILHGALNQTIHAISTSDVLNVLGFAKEFEFDSLKFQGWFSLYYNRLVKSSLAYDNSRRLPFSTWVFNLILEFAYFSRMLALMGESRITEFKGKRYHVPAGVISKSVGLPGTSAK